MAFFCQKNPYTQSIITEVLSCIELDGEVPQFEVTLADTIFFPEGGGQPGDIGRIGIVNVVRVFRRGTEAIHVTDQKLMIRSKHHCEIDWKRRYTHMQQHSAQHLLSAVFEEYNIKTVSWELGQKKCNIELDCIQVPDEVADAVESKVNAYIRDALPVEVLEISKVQSEEVYKSLGRLPLPDDVPEPIRLIKIGDVDLNPCCGTHVRNTSELQALKIMGWEKQRGRTRLYFVAGGRLIDRLARNLQNEQNLTKVLCCGPEDHYKIAQNLKVQSKAAEKLTLTLLRDLALQYAKVHLPDLKNRRFVLHHSQYDRKEYMDTFMKELRRAIPHDGIVIISCGPQKGENSLQISAPGLLDRLSSKQSRIFDILDGKGFMAKDGVVHGKINKPSKLSDVYSMLVDDL